MKKILVSLLFIAAIASCKKEETPVSKPYNIEYKIWGTPFSNASVSGTVNYVSKTSAATVGSVTNFGWNVVENNWNLKVGDKIGFTASVANFAAYQASIIVDGAVVVFRNVTHTLPTTSNLKLAYTIE
jgi:hypothetical protein